MRITLDWYLRHGSSVIPELARIDTMHTACSMEHACGAEGLLLDKPDPSCMLHVKRPASLACSSLPMQPSCILCLENRGMLPYWSCAVWVLLLV